MLGDVFGIMFSSHPIAPKYQNRRPYDVEELKKLLGQGKKPKEIADILGPKCRISSAEDTRDKTVSPVSFFKH
jgi:hypothetical protein